MDDRDNRDDREGGTTSNTNRGSHHGSVLTGKDLTVTRACGCGVIHLSIGACTLNLTAEAFRSVAAAMARAVRELDELVEAVPELPIAAPRLRLVAVTEESR